ncbi:MAG TPA: DUF1028 domain-containing protein [Clostridia bacterium]|jgi:uncharacterized Ntn-hydrolase superfamily protein|nr:DUF1028 domain-containing protein [Clostridia bacterium]
MTFSIVAYDPEADELGVAVQSKFLAVGALVPWAEAGVGAVATQSWANTSFGPEGIKLLKSGLSPQEAIDKLLAEDSEKEYRQVGIVDAQGRSANFTGEACFAWAGGVTGPNFACQGNILVNEATVTDMAAAFQKAKGDLASRLLEALAAAQKAGGDSRGKESAALLVVKPKGGYGGFNDKYIDLRVDDHPEPIEELIRLHELYKLYFYKTNPEDVIKIEDDVAVKIVACLDKLGYASGLPNYWTPELQEALKKYYLIENFDERIAPDGFIDSEVLKFMEKQAK